MGVSTHICHFLLLGGVDLHVLVFVVLADDETVVDFLAGTNEETAELLDLLKDVRGCDTFAHGNNRSFVVSA